MVVHVVTVTGSSTKVYKVFNDIRNAKEYVYKKYDGCIEKDFTQLNNNTHEAILDDGDIPIDYIDMDKFYKSIVYRDDDIENDMDKDPHAILIKK